MKLGTILRKWRLMSELSLRDAGKQMKVSAPALLRIEQGRAPSGVTLAKILNWMLK